MSKKVILINLLTLLLSWGCIFESWAATQQGGLPGLWDEVEVLEGQIDSLVLEADGPCYDDNNRYVDCGNGTVTDTLTGLIWTKDAGCIALQNFESANNTANLLGDGSCGLMDNSKPGDWRLPSQEEWAATIAEAVSLGCIRENGPSLTDTTGTKCFSEGRQPFDNFDAAGTNLYWSKTTVSDNPSMAYTWLTSGSTAGYTAKVNFVQGWAVRSDPEPDLTSKNPWLIFLPTIIRKTQKGCSDGAGKYKGPFRDNCPGFWAEGQLEFDLSPDCSISGVSSFGVRLNATLTPINDTTYSGSGQTDDTGCGQFSVTCTTQGDSITCQYTYTAFPDRRGSFTGARVSE